MKLWLVWLSLLAWAASSVAQTAPPLRVVLMPFVDRAGFQGKWELGLDVPRLLGSYLQRQANLEIVSIDTVSAVLNEKAIKKLKGAERSRAVGRRLDADVTVEGVVEKFGVRRTMAGDPNLVGYKTYAYKVKIVDVDLVQVVTQQLLGTCAVNLDSLDRPLGLDLFGRPRQQDKEFRELFKVDFAGKRFFELAFGRLVEIAFIDLGRQVVENLVKRPPIELSERAVVLAVEGEEVFLGLGKEDRVQYGDVLPVLSDKQHIALVQVRQVLGAHLCKGVIIEQQEPVESGLRLGQRLPPGGIE